MSYFLKFKSLEYVFDLLRNKSIFLNSPFKFNDPLDSYFITMFGHDKTSMPLSLQEYIDISANIVVFCGTTFDNLNSVLMWTHYADFHRGVALKYKIPSKLSGTIGPVKYDQHDHADFMHAIGGKNPYNIPNRTTEEKESDIFNSVFLKNADWAYENELRYVRKLHRTESPIENGWEIKEIYLGCRFLENDENKLEEIMRIIDICLELKIRIYTMVYDLDKSTNRFILSHQPWIENENCLVEENYYRIRRSILEEMKKRTLMSTKGIIIKEIAKEIAKEEIDRRVKDEIMKLRQSMSS